MEHNPRFCYDCENCKFHWCCGYECACVLTNKDQLQPTPVEVKVAVNERRLDLGLSMEFDGVD